MREVTVKELSEQFDWEQVAGDEISLLRQIELADTNRPGLELAGYFPETMVKRLVVIGEKESRYIEEEMDQISQRRSFEFLTNEQTPAIVIAHNQKVPEVLVELAMRKNFPVFHTKEKTSRTVINITNFLDEKLAESVIIHGELVRMFGTGVLITGPSGMGKSEIALELIKKGHQIVADDRVDCYNIHNTLVGCTPPLLKGYMEMRGVGVINVERMFGIGSFASRAEIALHIVLEAFDNSKAYDRIGIEQKEYSEICGIRILKIRIPVSSGRPMATIIETAVTNYLLIQNGIDSAKEFEDRVIQAIYVNKSEEDEEEENAATTK